MNSITKRLRRLSEDELYALCEAVDAEMSHRDEIRIGRGYRRSTYMVDVVRGKRCAPRYLADSARRLAA